MKKIILGLVVTGLFSVNTFANVFPRNSELSIESKSEFIEMTCTVTITVRNSSGEVIAQWNEYYTVADWDFAACNQIGRARVAQLQQSLDPSP